MSESEFWDLIDRAHQSSPRDPEGNYRALRKELQALPPEALADFARWYEEKQRAAYRWDLWAAAYILHGGCSDDSFMDFRACLAAAGRTVYERALQNPDFLADVEFEDPEEDLFFEGYQYLPADVYEEKTGAELPDTGVDYPVDPEGEEWDEDSPEDLGRICPRLYDRYMAD